MITDLHHRLTDTPPSPPPAGQLSTVEREKTWNCESGLTKSLRGPHAVKILPGLEWAGEGLSKKIITRDELDFNIPAERQEEPI